MTEPSAPTSKVNAQVTREEKLAALERVLASKRFVNAPMKQRFLRLICEFHIAGHGSELNEYLLGKEVFERGDKYSPATDPIVRVSAHSVREKLSLYNQHEGLNETIQIEIPIGSYEPIFIRRGNTIEPPTPVAESLATEVEPVLAQQQETPAKLEPLPTHPSTPSSQRWKNGLLYAALMFLAILAGYLFWLNRNLQPAAEFQTSQMRQTGGLAWRPFFQSQQPTLLILSNPVVHRLANDADPSILIQRGIHLSTEQINVLNNATGNRLPVATNLGPRLIPAFNMYTGIGEAIGAYRVSELFHLAGEPTILKQSRSISPDDLKNYDVILLGSVYSNQWSKPLSVKENFVYSSHSTIQNISPREGEPHEYKAVFDPQTGLLVEDYALITVTPGVTENRTVMVLAGIFSEGTEAAAEFVTDLTHLAELNQQLSKLKQPSYGSAYYQALLRVRVENAFPTTISLVTVRELQAHP